MQARPTRLRRRARHQSPTAGLHCRAGEVHQPWPARRAALQQRAHAAAAVLDAAVSARASAHQWVPRRRPKSGRWRLRPAAAQPFPVRVPSDGGRSATHRSHHPRLRRKEVPSATWYSGAASGCGHDELQRRWSCGGRAGCQIRRRCCYRCPHCGCWCCWSEPGDPTAAAAKKQRRQRTARARNPPPGCAAPPWQS